MLFRLLAVLLVLISPAAMAQTAVVPYFKTDNGGNSPVTNASPLPIGVYGGSSATSGLVLTSNGPGSLATFQAASSSGVASFSGGTTGLTPATATTGAVTLSGVLSVANGGTGNGAFTAGSVVFDATGGTLSQNNANFFWDNSNLRLGIGTATPASTLTISGSVSIGTSYAGIAAPTNGLSVLGPVGIGTSTTTRGLEVKTVGTFGLASASGNASEFIVQQSGTSGTVMGDNWNFTAFGAAATSGANAVTEYMRIIVGGNIGIRTTTPGTALVVNGGYSGKITAVADTAYTVLSTDYEIAYTSISAARVVSIPCNTLGSSTNPQYVIVKDQSGNAGITNTITVTPSSGTIDGAANKSFNSAYGEIRIYANGTTCFTW